MEFNDFALNYDEALQQGLTLSGESADYFARRRAEEVARYAAAMGYRTDTVLEFGCGTGNNVAHLRAFLGCRRFIGLDIAAEPLSVAQCRHPHPEITFKLVAEAEPEDTADLVFVNGVFHHIHRDNHTHTLETIHSLLVRGGLLALFDNNPFNLGARWVMKRIPFDRDARMVSPYGLARRARRTGFVDLTARFFFIFPRLLADLRPLEPRMEHLPFGAQYCIFARKP
ncbi:MAG: class I SAM-dependent methyltransferase [Phycisphaerales bacterium]|nr:MAG: class I SAM-dependent methyltransferase [Phycisphaerales bacterium]